MKHWTKLNLAIAFGLLALMSVSLKAECQPTAKIVCLTLIQSTQAVLGQSIASESRQSHQRDHLAFAPSQTAQAFREINLHKRQKGACGESEVKAGEILHLLSPLPWDGRLTQVYSMEVELGSPRAPPLSLS